jgi:hypothetical protein
MAQNAIFARHSCVLKPFEFNLKLQTSIRRLFLKRKCKVYCLEGLKRFQYRSACIQRRLVCSIFVLLWHGFTKLHGRSNKKPAPMHRRGIAFTPSQASQLPFHGRNWRHRISTSVKNKSFLPHICMRFFLLHKRALH